MKLTLYRENYLIIFIIFKIKLNEQKSDLGFISNNK